MAIITELDPIQVKAWIPYEVHVDQLRLLNLGGDHVAPEKALSRIEVFLTLPNGKKYPLPGKFSGGGYEFDPQSQVMEVMTEFPNPHLLLRPGLAVTLQESIKPS
jgi:hypothetical protein